ncbi:hypothetical protein EXY23_11520 [Roseicella aquatilis]|uniref:Uncharacterized protein n=1 Tax=Roseicella aquatilis TaxID=2527868 RepID=A0A4R4DN80_9PROT|nr:hypothetical protein EXY23_11520 [Roseicella aquatilis]
MRRTGDCGAFTPRLTITEAGIGQMRDRSRAGLAVAWSGSPRGATGAPRTPRSVPPLRRE